MDSRGRYRGSFPTGNYKIVARPSVPDPGNSKQPGQRLRSVYRTAHTNLELRGDGRREIVIRPQRGGQVRLRITEQQTFPRSSGAVAPKLTALRVGTDAKVRLNRLQTEDGKTVPPGLYHFDRHLISMQGLEPGAYVFRLKSHEHQTAQLTATVTLDQFCDLHFNLKRKAKR